MPLPTPRIHFVENLGNVWQLPNLPEWESGYWWRIGQANALALIGGHIYLHTAQAAPSHHGGIITGYRIQQGGEFGGRYVFWFRPTKRHLGVMADGRWSFPYKQMVLLPTIKNSGMNKEEIETAYHEAGHAIAAYRHGLYGGRITIRGTLGMSSSESEWADGSTDIEQIIVLYAGFASESTFYDNANRLGSSDDDEYAAYLLSRTNETESNLRIKAKELVDKNWKIIEVIAEKLFEYKTLEEPEWSIIIASFDEGRDWEEGFYNMRVRIALTKDLEE